MNIPDFMEASLLHGPRPFRRAVGRTTDRRRSRRRLGALLVVLVAAASLSGIDASPVRAQFAGVELVSNLSRSTSGAAIALAAQRFVTGGNLRDYDLASVEVELGEDQGNSNGLMVHVWRDDDNDMQLTGADSSIATLANPETLAAQSVNTFTAPADTVLETGRGYFVVISGTPDATGNARRPQFRIRRTSQTSEDSSFGFSIANSRLWREPDDAGWSANQNQALKLAVNGRIRPTTGVLAIISADTSEALYGTDSVSFTVTRTTGTSTPVDTTDALDVQVRFTQPANARYWTQPTGQDYIETRTVTIPAGATSATTVLDANYVSFLPAGEYVFAGAVIAEVLEGDGFVTSSASTASAGIHASAVVGLDMGSYEVDEGDGTLEATLLVRNRGGAPVPDGGTPIKVAALATDGDTATAGSDFTAKEFDFSVNPQDIGTDPADPSRWIAQVPVSIPLLDDSAAEPDETFTLRVTLGDDVVDHAVLATSADGGPTTGTGGIVSCGEQCDITVTIAGHAETTSDSTLVTNLSESRNTGQAGSIQAQRFTTGSNPEGYALTSVELWLRASSGRTSTNDHVQIWTHNNNTSRPRSLLAALDRPTNFTDDAANGFTVTDDSPIVLRPNTSYWVVVNNEVDETGDRIQPANTTPDADSSPGDPGWSIADERYSRAAPGDDWTSITASLSMRIVGRAAGVTTLSSLTVNGDGGELLVLNPKFAAGRSTFKVGAASDETKVRVRVTTTDPDASVAIQGDDDTASPNDASLTLSTSSLLTTRTVTVTGADGTATRTHTLRIVKATPTGTAAKLVGASTDPHGFVRDIAHTRNRSRFFTGDNATGYTVTSLRLAAFGSASGLDSNDTFVELWTRPPSASGSTRIASLINPGSFPSDMWTTFTFPANTVLEPDDDYWIVINRAVPTGNTRWGHRNTTYFSPDTNSAFGWSIDNRVILDFAGTVNVNTFPTMILFGYPNSASAEARLGGLSVTNAFGEAVSLSPSFDQDTNSYTATVSNDSHSVTVVATALDAGAVISIEGDDDTSTPGEATLDLDEGANTIRVTVTAQDRISQQVYEVGLTRSALDGVLVGNLSLPAPTGDDLVMAQSFTTGTATDEVFTVTGVSLELGAGNSALGRSNPFVTVNTDDSGVPGAVVGTLRNPSRLLDEDTNMFVAPGAVVLEPDTKYWLVINERSGAERLTVLTTSDDGSVTGTIGSGRLTKQTASDASWSSDARQAVFAVHGVQGPDTRTTGFVSLDVATPGGDPVVVRPAEYDASVSVYEALVDSDTTEVVVRVAPETGGSTIVIAGDTDPGPGGQAQVSVAEGFNDFSFTVDSGSAGSATYTVRVGRPRALAAADALVSNAGEVPQGFEAGGRYFVYHQGFHTGDHPDGYHLEDIGLSWGLLATYPADRDGFTVDLHELNSDGTLGDFVFSLEQPDALTASAVNYFAAPLGAWLAPNTDYAIRLAKDAFDGSVSFTATNSDAETLAAFETGWTIRDEYHFNTVPDANASLQISVRGRRWPSADNTLTDLRLTEVLSDTDIELSPAFDSETLTYNITVRHQAAAVTVSATAASSGADVVGLTADSNTGYSGDFDLDVGSNTLEVEITSQFGDVRTYAINVAREAALTAEWVAIPDTHDNTTTFEAIVEFSAPLVLTTTALEDNITVTNADLDSVEAVAGFDSRYRLSVTPDSNAPAGSVIRIIVAAPTNRTDACDPASEICTAEGTLLEADLEGELAGLPLVSVSSASATEGGRVTFTVEMNTTRAADVTVAYATTVESDDTATLDATAPGGADYTTAGGTLTIPAGDLSATFDVQTLGDSTDEHDETFTVTLSDPTEAVLSGNSTAKGTIVDDDDPPRLESVTPTPRSFTESASGTVTLRLSAVSGKPVRVRIERGEDTVGAHPAALDVDLTPIPPGDEVVEFAPGDLEATHQLGIATDDFDEFDETFLLTFTAVDTDALAVPASLESVTVTILDDDDPPSVTVADASAIEGSPLEFVVTLSEASGRPVTVPFSAAGSGTNPATAGSDFTAPVSGASIVIPAGDATGTISIATLADTVDESDAPETLLVTLGAPTNATLGSPATATGTIRDDPFEISPRRLSIVEGASGSFTVALASAPSVTVSVDISAAAGSDLTVTPATLSFTTVNWATARTVTVDAGEDADSAVDTDELTLTAAATGDSVYDGAAAKVAVTVTDTDEPELVADPEMLTIGETHTRTFELSLATQPKEAVTVTVESGDAGKATVTPETLTFNDVNWATTQPVTVRATDDDDASNETVIITATAETPSGSEYHGEQAEVTVAVTDNDEAKLLPSHLLQAPTEDSGHLDFAVRLATRPTDTVAVTISSDKPDVLSVPSTSLTFTTGNWATEQSFTGMIHPDDDGFDEDVKVTLSATGGDYTGLTAEVDVDVEDTDRYLDVVSGAKLELDESDSRVVRLRLSTEPTGDVTVTAVSSDTGKVTVESVTRTFTTTNWATPQEWTVRAVDDDDAEDHLESVTFTAEGASYDGETAKVTVEVIDLDDRGVTRTVVDPPLTPEGDWRIPEGGSGTYTLVLDTQPTAAVTLTPISALVSFDPTSVTFTESNWDMAVTVTVTVNHDSDRIDNTIGVTHDVSGGGYGAEFAAAAIFALTAVDDDKTPPSAPGNLTATPGFESVTLRWSAPTDNGGAPIDGYEVQVDGTWVSTGSLATSYVVRGLTNTVTYRFKVRATNALGEGEATPAVSAAPVPLLVTVRPAAAEVTEGEPVRFELVLSNPTTDLVVNVSWDFGEVDLASGYDRTVSYSGRSSSGPLVTAVRTLDDAVIEPDGAVTIRLRPGDGYTVASPSMATVRVRDNDGGRVPGPPFAPRALASSPTSLELTWQPPADRGNPAQDTRYDLRYRATGETTWQAGPQDLDDNAARLEGLQADTGYQIQARATNAQGTGAWSPTGTGRTTTTAPVTVTVAIRRDVLEGQPLRLVVTATPAPASALSVNLDISETGDTLSTTRKSVTIEPGRSSVELRLNTVDDSTDEDHSRVTVTLLPHTTYNRGDPSVATRLVVDNDEQPDAANRGRPTTLRLQAVKRPDRTTEDGYAEDITVGAWRVQATWNWPTDWPRHLIRAWLVEFAYTDCTATVTTWLGPIILGADPATQPTTSVQWLGPNESVHMRVAAIRQGDAGLGPYSRTTCTTTPPD